MTVLFRKSVGGAKFLKVWNEAKRQNNGLALIDMNEKSYGSKILGYTLDDASATDFALRFDREFFAENYNEIIDSHESLGTYETIIYLIKAALGKNTSVTFETPEPAYLIISVLEASENKGAITLEGDRIMAMDGEGGLNYLMFKSTSSEYTLTQVRAMLRSIEATGVYVEYNFIKES